MAKTPMSEIGERQLAEIEDRLLRIAEALEPHYRDIDALSDEASALLKRRANIRGFEYEAVEGSKMPRPLRAEFAMDPFTVTVRTFGRQRRLTLQSCSKPFYLFNVVPHLLKALAEIGFVMEADESNILTVSRESWDTAVVAALQGENEEVGPEEE